MHVDDILLSQHDALLFRGVDLTPEQQYKLVKVRICSSGISSMYLFLIIVILVLRSSLRGEHPLGYSRVSVLTNTTQSYGHGNNKTGNEKKSILHPDLKTIPRQPQVQLIGNGTVYDHEGLSEAMLKHPSHTTFHKSRISEEDSAKGITRFYRWHIDAALYELAPPKVTALYGIKVPQGPPQTCRYDDGTGDELQVPLGTTAFVSGKTMFDILPAELKSLAVRTKVKFAPHCFVWMAPAHAHSTGLALETEGLELPYDELPPWDESKVVTLPMVRCPSALEIHLF